MDPDDCWVIPKWLVCIWPFYFGMTKFACELSACLVLEWSRKQSNFWLENFFVFIRHVLVSNDTSLWQEIVPKIDHNKISRSSYHLVICFTCGKVRSIPDASSSSSVSLSADETSASYSGSSKEFPLPSPLDRKNIQNLSIQIFINLQT